MISQILKPSVNDVPQMVKAVEDFLYGDRNEGFVNHFSSFSFNRTKLVSFIVKAIGSSGYFIRVIKREDGKILGGILAYAVSPVFSDDMIVEELLLYFSPDQVGTASVFELISSLEDWAKEIDAKEIHIANSSGFKQEKFAILMKRKGYNPFSFGYSKGVC